MAKQNIPTPCKQFSLERFSKAGDFFLTKAVCEIAESEMEKTTECGRFAHGVL